ncbi:MAG: hypothetical protein LBT38_07510, partial [Deltaproteobacteria bacterium]|nr:hypothetical protein [Deltaproteobacteria bacterium]
METLIVDGQERAATDISGRHLEEILVNLMEHPEINGRVITRVSLNGAPYEEEVPHAALEVARQEISSLSLKTLTMEDVSLTFLEAGPTYLNTLIDALPKIVENFRIGDEQEANEHFLNFLEALHLMMSMLEQTRHILGLWQGQSSDSSSALNHYLETMV